jgi:hypothetical protein
VDDDLPTRFLGSFAGKRELCEVFAGKSEFCDGFSPFLRKLGKAASL